MSHTNFDLFPTSTNAILAGNSNRAWVPLLCSSFWPAYLLNTTAVHCCQFCQITSMICKSALRKKIYFLIRWEGLNLRRWFCSSNKIRKTPNKHPNIVCPVKMEYGWHFSISGLKMMVKSDLEKIFLKFLHVKAIFY